MCAPLPLLGQADLKAAIANARQLLQPPRPDPSTEEGRLFEEQRQAKRRALAEAKEKEKAAADAAAAEAAAKSKAKPPAPAKGAAAVPATPAA